MKSTSLFDFHDALITPPLFQNSRNLCKIVRTVNNVWILKRIIFGIYPCRFRFIQNWVPNSQIECLTI